MKDLKPKAKKIIEERQNRGLIRLLMDKSIKLGIIQSKYFPEEGKELHSFTPNFAKLLGSPHKKIRSRSSDKKHWYLK